MTILATTAHRGGQVCIPATSGGCGQVHKYEDMPAGYPGITCPACEDVLRKDSQHAMMASEVPETYDEGRIREDLEKRGALNERRINVAALAAIASRLAGDGDMLGMAMGATVARCPDGHASPADSRFCAQCGQAIPLLPQGSLCPEGHPCPGGVKFCPSCGTAMAAAIDATAVTAVAEDRSRVKLRDRRLDELQAMCRDQNLDESGTRADLIERLRANA